MIGDRITFLDFPELRRPSIGIPSDTFPSGTAMKTICLVLTLSAFFYTPPQCAGQSSSNSPPFRVRGVLPWHNFLSGPSSWDAGDYERYLDQCRDKGINFIGFHTYTGGGQRYVTYVEPMIKIQYKQVLPEAFWDNSLTARWGYEPMAIGNFCCSSAGVFPEGRPAFGADCSVLATDNPDRYRRAQELMQQVVAMAHARGMKVAIGFEFGVHPPEFFSLMEEGLYWEGTGTLIPNPTHYQAIEILDATIDNLLSTYADVDFIWLWLNEHSFFGFDAAAALKDEKFRKLYDRFSPLFEGTDARQRLIGVWSLQYLRLAYEHIRRAAPGVGIILGGWGGNDQLPAILKGLDRGLPEEIVFSCLTPGMGQYPQPAVLGEIARHRRFWAIPWLEGDNQLWHYQPRVNVLREQVKEAGAMKMDGVVAIHWRTEETRLNLECFSRFAGNPDDTSSVEDAYRDYFLRECGDVAAGELAAPFARFDREGWVKGAVSPEYYAYTPAWGRLDSAGKELLKELSARIGRVQRGNADRRYAANLEWLRANIEFALLLDEIGVRLEPAYELRQRYAQGFPSGESLRETVRRARASLDEAPVERLIRLYAARVRSRGELGVLSSLNQKLFSEYLGLRKFLSGISE